MLVKRPLWPLAVAGVFFMRATNFSATIGKRSR
jgi:hypothetical protein